jgi:hypothetical protein
LSAEVAGRGSESLDVLVPDGVSEIDLGGLAVTQAGDLKCRTSDQS